MSEFDVFFKGIIKKVNNIVDKKKIKYSMLDIVKIKQFLLTWTKHYLSQQKRKDIKVAFYEAIIVFEMSCNMATEKLNKEK